MLSRASLRSIFFSFFLFSTFFRIAILCSSARDRGRLEKSCVMSGESRLYDATSCFVSAAGVATLRLCVQTQIKWAWLSTPLNLTQNQPRWLDLRHKSVSRDVNSVSQTQNVAEGNHGLCLFSSSRPPFPSLPSRPLSQKKKKNISLCCQPSSSWNTPGLHPIPSPKSPSSLASSP